MFSPKDVYKQSRVLYIIEAALEYFISMSFESVYLCRLTAFLGFSDTLTGILTAFVSLGATFQIFALFIAKERNVKGMVTAGHIISQLFFCLCYFIPFFAISAKAKVALFVVILLFAYVIHNLIHPFKISWYMSLIEDAKRGRFTALKETVSLLGGMAFSYALGYIIDSCTVAGRLKAIAFLVIGFIMVAFTLIHSFTLVFSKEKAEVVYNKKTSLKGVWEILSDKKLLIILPVSVLWNVAMYFTRPFLGTYQEQELQFTAQLSSIIIIAGSLLRAVFAHPFGKIADKSSFANMLVICMVIEIASFFIMAFTTPVLHTEFLYWLHFALYCIGMAGINSATINLIYDYVKKEKITCALAVNTSLAGLIGFLATLMASPVVSTIQANGNTLFGLTVYAQQVLSFVSGIIAVGILLYLIFVVKKIDKNKDNDSGDNKEE